MIIELICNLFLIIINITLGWLPMFTVPADMLNSIGGIIELLAIASQFMPIGVLQVALTVFIGFHALEFAISIVNWVIAKIPTID